MDVKTTYIKNLKTFLNVSENFLLFSSVEKVS